jgi:arylformamidase
MAGDWIDVSVPLKSAWCTGRATREREVDRVLAIERGDQANVSSISMGSHTGTHMDRHSITSPAASTLDQMPLDTAIGPAR